LISGGFGALDLGLELYPVQIAGQDAKDLVRVGTTLGSYFLNWMGRFPGETEVLFYSSLPLTIKTVYNYVKGFTGARRAPVRYGLQVTPTPAIQRQKLEFIGIR